MDGERIVGTIRSADGIGVLRIEARYDTDIDDLWSALTDPARLARWYGEVEGDLRPGGRFTTYIKRDDWRGNGSVEACEPPRRLVIAARETDESAGKGSGAAPFDEVTEITLTGAGDHTILVAEMRGLPLDKIDYFAVGNQIHAENLATHVAGREVGDTEPRWDVLLPGYQEQATRVR